MLLRKSDKEAATQLYTLFDHPQLTPPAEDHQVLGISTLLPLPSQKLHSDASACAAQGAEGGSTKKERNALAV